MANVKAGTSQALVLDKMAIVATDKEACKSLHDMFADDDKEGIIGLYTAGKVEMIPAGNKFYVVSIGVWRRYVRYHGITYYNPQS
jgi:hypothetical protein